MRLMNLAFAAVTPIVEIIKKIITADKSTQKFLSPSEMEFENVVIIKNFMKAHRRQCPDVLSGLNYVVIF